ncbi:receptor-like protein 47 [Lactuca sativa]|uniref:Leucine-rich repeat-containing N-terminal plant-type domain-containing protein n=1 Tax=Lactuca sativa TaxID=4236 RepID=A0A9R1USI5_LACSA|nr:receptor-like protein 47 [Lactuca sativa]KAJ0192312.1 hypothetical protein LSAT_V11C800445270 [Lactuca sativa]
MGNQRGSLGLHLIFVCVFLFATACTCLGVGKMSVVCSEQERAALFKFKHSVKDDFEILSSWVGNDCCLWEGIQCDSVTGTVESLHLRGDWGYFSLSEGYFDYVGEGYLVGDEVNSSLAELSHLKYLDLSRNYFKGSRIPEFIGSLKQLVYLNLSNAGFQGIIPPHIGNLSNLKVLDLSSNYGMKADDMAWTFGLPLLQHLDLSSLDLSGTKNWNMVYIIPSLKRLSLSRCRLSSIHLSPSFNSSRVLPNIRHLDLGFNYFKGSLPGFFQNITSLVFLDLSNFGLNYAWKFANLLNVIPSLLELHVSGCGLHNTHLSHPHINFSVVSNIQHLDLSANSIGDVFPSVLTNMSSLRVLDLSRNMLNSSVPVMPNLLELDLSSNRFKQIEQVGIWRQCYLKKLSASKNPFDIEMIESLQNISECTRYALERLDLHESLYGTIPQTIGRLANLRGLDLSRSGLTGPIPKSLGRLRFLEVLDLSSNELTGPIPTFHAKLAKLDLSYNHLKGSIPESFGNLSGLTYVDLSFNRLMGPIPASLGRLVSLQAISVSSNFLNGTIPVSVGQLADLRSLDISNNSLEGVFSEAHFANLSMLKSLDTSFNTKLIFNVSRDWIPPFQLVVLQIRCCNIANGFPQWLRNQMKLRELVLSNATITGPLPTWLKKMPIVPFLELSHNKLSGPLTNLPNGKTFDVYGYFMARVLFLQDNLFNESIPRSLCRRGDLDDINLSRNRLTGKIPKCLENLQSLRTMAFSSNRLSGVIPNFNSSSLRWLQLNSNNFIGEIPQALRNLQKLFFLDMADNALSGNIPQFIGEKLPSLIVLRLRQNNFNASIPQSLCKASTLHILDVAHNNLTGTIPPCLGELNAMIVSSKVVSRRKDYGTGETLVQFMKGVDLEYINAWAMVFNMDLSSNKLVGEIPDELTALTMLMGLNLSNNHLTGGIPDTIGNMLKLESLDFSRNELNGVIPPSMAALTFLSHLNLSHNNLSGQIPAGNQLQTLDDPSIYVGNKDLCGPPLLKNCSNHENPITRMPKKQYNAVGEPSELWFYVDIMSGFITGFWGIIGVLLFKKKWRQNLFTFAEETMDKILIAVIIGVAKMKKVREGA